MTAKLTFPIQSPIPAGIFGEGIEPFWYNGEKCILVNGNRYRYNEAPTSAKAAIQRAFSNDRQSIAYMSTKMGLKTASEMFETWYRCVVGGLDSVADITEKRFTPDAYNNLCGDAKCPHRGLFCGRAFGIRQWQAETIKAMKEGCSMESVANKVNVTHAAIKSRVSKLFEQSGSKNTAQLICWATELGI